MIDLKLNSKRLRLHWQYYAWRYAVGIAAAVLVANILFTATKPQIPYERKVEIIIYYTSGTGSSEAEAAWQNGLLRILPPDQSVFILTTPVIQGEEPTISQVASARMAAREGTIWIVPKDPDNINLDFFTGYAASGAFIPLDGILSQLGLPEDIDLAAGTVTAQPDESLPAETHVYGIPLGQCKGLSELFNPSSMMLVLPTYAEKNLQNAIIAMQWLLSRTEEPQAPADPNQFTVAIASNYFSTYDTGAWRQALQQRLNLGSDVSVSLMPYHTGREDMVAQDMSADRLNKPGLCVVPRGVFIALARNGALMPLDDSLGRLAVPEGTDLSPGRETVKAAPQATGAAPVERLYGIPLDKCRGLTELFNPDGMVLVIPVQPRDSFEAALDAANWMLGKTG